MRWAIKLPERLLYCQRDFGLKKGMHSKEEAKGCILAAKADVETEVENVDDLQRALWFEYGW
jgi:hypothetical protein